LVPAGVVLIWASALRIAGLERNLNNSYKVEDTGDINIENGETAAQSKTYLNKSLNI
jgi:hypothetical protein